MKQTKLASIESVGAIEYEHLDAWGEQYEWVRLLTPMWKSIGVSEYRLKYVPSSDPQEDAGWWFAAIHLLGFGLGWNNIGIGLERWRLEGYPEAHPILTLIKKVFGQSIEALEIWARYKGQDIDAVFARRALDMNGQPIELKTPPKMSETEYRERVRNFQATANGPRSLQAAEHFLGDNQDSLHLASHLYLLLDQPTPRWHNLDRRPIGLVTGYWFMQIVHLDNAKGLSEFFRLNTSEIFAERAMGGINRLLLEIENPGLIMPLEYSLSTGRWFWQDLVKNRHVVLGPESWGTYFG